MHDAVVARPPLASLLAWTAVALLLLLQLYLLSFDQGALSRAGDLLHEFTHDGRHLLGAPCH